MGNESRPEASMLPSPEVFQRFAERSRDAMAIHRDGRVVWANQSMATLAGVAEPGQLVGRAILDFVRPDERATLVADISRSLAIAQASSRVQTFVRADGTEVEAELQRLPVGDGLVLAIMRSLEPEKATARQQRSAELRARAFFDATTQPLGISRRGIHVEANRAYAALFGFADPAELVGKPILDLIDPSEHERIRDLVRRRASGTLLPSAYTTRARRKDGSLFEMDVKASSYPDGDEQVTVVVVSDVTAQQAEEARLRHREKLEAIGRLAGGVAHDFNNILAAILGNAELALTSRTLEAPVREGLGTIVEATARARDLVRQILTFGRRDRPSPQALDLGQVVTDAVGLARAGVPATVALELTVAPLGGTVLADVTQVHQIVLNLLANARDAVGSAGHVAMELGPVAGPAVPAELGAGPWARLRVRDDGEGMNEATRAHLFEPYLTTKAEHGGHGLGLAVVHGIVTGLGGAIVVDSTPGRGATFDLFFPVATAPARPVSTAAPVVGGAEHVLVVDDEPMVRGAVSRLLETLGYRVTAAADGAEALERVRAAPTAYDLVLSDVSMPRLSGVELARALRELSPAPRVVLVTGFSDAVDERLAHELGLKGVLTKPLTRAELDRAVRAALTA